MFYQIFLSPQAKRCAIITYKQGISAMPHELPNDIRLQDLTKLGNIKKMCKHQSPLQTENFVNTNKKLLKNRN